MRSGRGSGVCRQERPVEVAAHHEAAAGSRARVCRRVRSDDRRRRDAGRPANCTSAANPSTSSAFEGPSNWGCKASPRPMRGNPPAPPLGRAFCRSTTSGPATAARACSCAEPERLAKSAINHELTLGAQMLGIAHRLRRGSVGSDPRILAGVGARCRGTAKPFAIAVPNSGG